ncbi:hypothetical protein HQQ80_06975 [Microbacteriaceae bacterium VKM Ac-2855]|nr:hypothetical protein [Microbacteriaceae bacterium VKM Ac-2855]
MTDFTPEQQAEIRRIATENKTTPSFGPNGRTEAERRFGTKTKEKK